MAAVRSSGRVVATSGVIGCCARRCRYLLLLALGEGGSGLNYLLFCRIVHFRLDRGESLGLFGRTLGAEIGVGGHHQAYPVGILQYLTGQPLDELGVFNLLAQLFEDGIDVERGQGIGSVQHGTEGVDHQL